MISINSFIKRRIGNTPLIQLNGEQIFAKAEFLNYSGSIKDRIALTILETAEEKGLLKPGMKIIEPTSGNTGISIAMIGVAKGYEVFIVMPEGMSMERKNLISSYGGKLILTPDKDGINGAVKLAEELATKNGFFLPNQFKNPLNPYAHYISTAPEIWQQSNGEVDIFISGIGSGGSLQGIGKYLKKLNPKTIIAAVEPENFSALLGHEPGLHQIQGIGDGFVPEILDVSLINEIIEVPDKEAIITANELATKHSLLVGISSGANIWAARKLLRKYPEARIVTLLPDRAERYFSTGLFEMSSENIIRQETLLQKIKTEALLT